MTIVAKLTIVIAVLGTALLATLVTSIRLFLWANKVERENKRLSKRFDEEYSKKEVIE